MTPHKPKFKLFRSSSPANRCEYVGSVTLATGEILALEANVVEHDRSDGTKGKHFEGQVFPAGHLTRQMLRSAKVDGVLPDDLVAMMQSDEAARPFNDTLPVKL